MIIDAVQSGFIEKDLIRVPVVLVHTRASELDIKPEVTALAVPLARKIALGLLNAADKADDSVREGVANGRD